MGAATATDHPVRSLVVSGTGRWGWYDPEAYERVEHRHADEAVDHTEPAPPS